MPPTERDRRRLDDAHHAFEKARNGFGAILVGGAADVPEVGRNVLSAYAWWVWPGRLTEPNWDAAVRQYVDSDRAAAWRDARTMMISPWAEARDEACARYVGTLLARINLNRNPRLRAALETHTPDEQLSELAERLPGAVGQALREGYVGDDPRAILRRATRLIEKERFPTSRQYRSRQRGRGSDGYDEHRQPWPVPSHVYDPARSVVHMLSCGTPPEVVDEALRSLGMGTFAQVVERTSFWKPKVGRELDEVMVRRPWEWAPAIDEFVAREHAAAISREPTVEVEFAEAVAEMAEQCGLSAREAEVVLLFESLTHREIAERLGITRNTSKSHLNHARLKIQAARARTA